MRGGDMAGGDGVETFRRPPGSLRPALRLSARLSGKLGKRKKFGDLTSQRTFFFCGFGGSKALRSSPAFSPVVAGGRESSLYYTPKDRVVAVSVRYFGRFVLLSQGVERESERAHFRQGTSRAARSVGAASRPAPLDRRLFLF